MRLTRFDTLTPLAFALLLSACGGGSSDSTPTEDGGGPNGAGGQNPGEVFADGTTLMNAGAEPRVQLRAATADETLLQVSVTANESLQFDGSTSNDDVAAVLDIHATLTPTDSGNSELVLLPNFGSYSPLPTVEASTIPGSWRRTYNPLGTATAAATTDQNGVFALNSLNAMQLPSLVLGVPEGAVGIGASWVWTITTEAGQIRTTTRLNGMSNDALNITLETTLIPNADGPSATLAVNLAGSFDRQSLMLQAATVDTEIQYSGEVNRNGVAMDFVKTRTLRHEISEASL